MPELYQKQRIFLFFLVLTASAAFSIAAIRYRILLVDPDTLWHTRIGQSILQDGWPGGIEKFSHSFKGQPFVEVEWLSQLIYYLAYSWAGWAGTVLLAVSAIALTSIVLFLALGEHLKPLHASFFAVLLPIVSSATLLARPHVLALPLMTFWVWRMFRSASLQRRPEFWLLLLLPVWVNLHPSYAMACFFAGVAFLDVAFETRLRDRSLVVKWLAFLALCPLMVLLNPNGIRPLLIAVHVAIENNVVPDIREWQPYKVGGRYLLDGYFFAVIASLLVFRPKMPAVRAAMFMFSLYVFMKHMRFVFVYVLLLPLALVSSIVRQFPALSKDRWMLEPSDKIESFIAGQFRITSVFAGLLVPVASIIIVLVKPLPASVEFGKDAMTYIASSHVSGNVFNHYNYGGLLIFNDIPTFVDGRTDQLFLGKFWDDYQASEKTNGEVIFRELLNQYNIEWTMLPPDDTRNLFLAGFRDWHKAYADEFAVIYRKN